MIAITIIQEGNAATVDEDLTVISKNEALQEAIEDEVDFATYGDVSALPVLLILYQNLKNNTNYKVVIEQEVLDELKGGNDGTETIF